MKVAIDLEVVPGQPWRGTLHAQDGSEPVRFDGRLELLRRLEAVAALTPEGSGPHDRRTTT